MALRTEDAFSAHRTVPSGGYRVQGGPPPSSTARGTRIGGLDGLRAVAVSAVVLYHLGVGWLPGGFLGVDLFFVISGFLITTLLLAEVEASGGIALHTFYVRRARRLLPALFLVLVVTLILAATVARDVAHQTVHDLPGALLFVSNWWTLDQEHSYFDLIGRGNLLGHLWSLAVEEQFYLVWPLLLGALAVLARRTGWQLRRVVLVVAGVGAVASTVWMMTMAISRGIPIDVDPTRAYIGTDTHAMSLLAGAAVAAVWNVRRFRADLVPGARAVLMGTGVLGLIGAGLLFAGAGEYSSWLYRGGFLVVACVFALTVAAATHPGSPLGRALDVGPMRWVGERSYGIYLWHWPVLLVTRPGIDMPWVSPMVNVARLGLVLVVAELSYRYLEVPVRRGALGAWWRQRRAAGAGLLPTSSRGRALIGSCAAVGLVVVGLLITAPTSEEVAVAHANGGGTADVVDATAPSPADSANGAGLSDVWWYGDSVTLWVADQARTALPGVRIDAGLNRSPGFIMDHVATDLAAGTLGPIVVMHLGNAGPIPVDALDRTLAALANRTRVVLVNSTARFAFVTDNNRKVGDAAAAHPNVVLVDWHEKSAQHPEWFTDGLHLTDVGAEAFTALIADAALGSGTSPGM